MPQMLNSQLLLLSFLRQIVAWMGTRSPTLKPKRSAVWRPTIAQVRSESQAFFWSSGRTYSGYSVRSLSGYTGHCMKKLLGFW